MEDSVFQTPKEFEYKIDKKEFISVLELVKRLIQTEKLLYATGFWNENNPVSQCANYLIDILRNATSGKYAMDEIMSYLIPYWCYEADFGNAWSKDDKRIVEDGKPVDLSSAEKLWEFITRATAR